MAPFEALYGRKCQTPSCWYQDGESMIVGPEMVHQITEKVKNIKEKMKASQDRKKSYADKRRRPLDFEEGDHVFLHVTPTTGVGRAIKTRKLTPKFIGPYQITSKIGPVAYRIALPPFLSGIHDVFHVSQLRKYIPDPSHVIKPDTIQLKDNLSFKAIPVRIEDRKMKLLRNKEIPLVKIIWNHATGDATWELESEIREKYPELFTDTYIRGRNSFRGEYCKAHGELYAHTFHGYVATGEESRGAHRRGGTRCVSEREPPYPDVDH
ncbi:uncharacterized protein LOC131597496 [Vicia villosa]|uniref:uncharacterized protein LOC131597496 n=1 Tax=Vicia villosa TaxID=3911 RepID=UPI00273C123F|nr:uncharacterized protein LOC131597496 [Vicia villosa]